MIVYLDNDFTPKFASEQYTTSVDGWYFPANEFGIKILPSFNMSRAVIVARLNSNESFIKLLLVTDALRNQGVKDINLIVSYLAYARQDRIMTSGEPFSLRVIANLINSQNYSSVEVFDSHSIATELLIKNCTPISNYHFVSRVLSTKSNYLLVCPDLGAAKKFYKLIEYLRYDGGIIQCNKIRDLSNGQIKKFSVTTDSNIPAAHECVIVDDLCSKGGTFINIANELKARGARKVSLIVSHYENTADQNLLRKSIDEIYCTNSFCDIESNDFIKQIKLSGDLL